MPHRTKEDIAAYQKRYRQSPAGKAIKRAAALKYQARMREEKADREYMGIPVPMSTLNVQQALSTWGNTR